jgi:hypothetical protein
MVVTNCVFDAAVSAASGRDRKALTIVICRKRNLGLLVGGAGFAQHTNFPGSLPLHFTFSRELAHRHSGGSLGGIVVFRQ